MAQAEAPPTVDIERELRRLRASERELATLAQQANEGYSDLRDVYRLVVNARESAAKIGSALFAMGGVPTEPSW